MSGDAPRVEAMPSGLVTFLFTDIEGSTRLFEELGDEYLDALEQHRSIIRGAVARHSGYEVKTEGDGFFITFTDAAEAVAACYDAQRALTDATWPKAGAIRVRMGLHTDDAEPTVDGDYMTVGVHLAARVSAAAHGGQVLLSRATAHHVEGRLPHGAGLAERGQFRLKGFREPERLFQLVHPSLRSEFPPLHASPAEGHALPSMRTSFVGRTEEVQELVDLLAENRLATIVGPGGAGKTRLALEVAARLSVYSDGGTMLCDLSPVTDAGLVAGAIASALGVHSAAADPIEAAARTLAGRSVLLVVDNCEQVIDAAAQTLDELLTSASGLRVLATSREPLNISGEQVWRIPGLSLPAPDCTPQELADSTCGRLFEERARLVSPQFRIDDSNCASIARICGRCEGLPLAIELAAARVSVMPVATIATHLSESLSAYGAGPRTSTARHRTMEGAIDWGYRLLTDDEQRLLRQLAAFAGGFKLEAVQAVAPDIDVLRVLAGLVEKSLVVFDADADRYRLLEPIRQFAEARLRADADDDARTQRAHAGHFAELARSAESPLAGPDQAEWLDGLSLEHDNLRRAISHLLAVGCDSDAARMLTAIRRYWFIRGDPVDWLALSQPLLLSEKLPLPDRGWLLCAAAMVGMYQDPRNSLRWATRALEAGNELSDDRLIAEGASCVAAASYLSGNPDPDTGQRAVSVARKLGDPGLLGFALVSYALTTSDDSTVREALNESFAATARSGDLWVRSVTAGNLAIQSSTDRQEAHLLFAEALRLGDVLGDQDPLTMANAAYSALVDGRSTEARELLLKALGASGRSAYDSLAALDSAAAWAAASGRLEVAARLCGFITHTASQAGIATFGPDVPIGIDGWLTDHRQVRDQLGDRYLVECQAGAELSWTEALTLARTNVRTVSPGRY